MLKGAPGRLRLRVSGVACCWRNVYVVVVYVVVAVVVVDVVVVVFVVDVVVVVVLST